MAARYRQLFRSLTSRFFSSMTALAYQRKVSFHPGPSFQASLRLPAMMSPLERVAWRPSSRKDARGPDLSQARVRAILLVGTLSHRFDSQAENMSQVVVILTSHVAV